MGPTTAQHANSVLEYVIGCQAAHEAISALVDGESAPISEALMKAHLAECQNCREFQERSFRSGVR